ncbi:MAG TPA: hypothetical protein ENN42_05735 [Thioalkalivibrio sp.]|mgnify:CR=1 FL=1|nr:hypothetical protein [Thioalkalivibrio sp.]
MRYLMLTLPALLFLSLASATAAGQCLEVKDPRIDPDRTDTDSSALAWAARIENTCDRAYDADITVHFTNEEDESIYEVRKLITVERRGATEAGARQYLPAIYMSDITGIDIDIEERKRPY